MNKEKIYIGADHRGFTIKEILKQWLYKQGFDVIDKGAKKLVSDDDYPDFGAAVGEALSKEPTARGILICGSSLGVCVTANKYKGVRAGSLTTLFEAEHAATADNINVACLSSNQTSIAMMKKILSKWLETEFEGGRHLRRIKKIEKLEKRNFK